MTNQELPEEATLNVIAPSGGLTVGIPALLGSPGMVVMPTETVVAGKLTAVKFGGGYRIPKNTSTALATVGALVDWDPTPGEIVATGAVATNFKCGHVVEAALAADTTALIMLTTAPVTVNP